MTLDWCLISTPVRVQSLFVGKLSNSTGSFGLLIDSFCPYADRGYWYLPLTNGRALKCICNYKLTPPAICQYCCMVVHQSGVHQLSSLAARPGDLNTTPYELGEGEG